MSSKNGSNTLLWRIFRVRQSGFQFFFKTKSSKSIFKAVQFLKYHSGSKYHWKLRATWLLLLCTLSFIQTSRYNCLGIIRYAKGLDESSTVLCLVHTGLQTMGRFILTSCFCRGGRRNILIQDCLHIWNLIPSPEGVSRSLDSKTCEEEEEAEELLL